MSEKLKITPKDEHNPHREGSRSFTRSHGKGSRTEGSENFGQTKRTTIYTAGESGMNPGSAVKKTEFSNNQSERRKRVTEYLNSARKVTRYEDKVVVEMPDGTVREFYRKNSTERQERPKNPEKEKVKDGIRRLLETVSKEPNTKGREVAPLSAEESLQLNGRERRNFTPDQYINLIGRLREIPQKISELQAEVQRLLSEDPEDVVLEQELKNAIINLQKQEREIQKKILKSRQDRERQEKIKVEIQTALKALSDHREDKFKRESDRRKKVGEIYDQIEALQKGSWGFESALKQLSQEYMILTSKDFVESSIKEANIDESLESVTPAEGQTREDIKKYLEDLVRRKYYREVDNLALEVKDEYDAENPNTSQVDLPRTELSLFHNPINQDAVITNLHGNPEFRGKFKEDEIISEGYRSLRDRHINDSLSEMSIQTMDSKSREYRKVTEYYRDLEAAKFVFARLSHPNDVVLELTNYLNSLPENVLNGLREFYGKDVVDSFIKFSNEWRKEVSLEGYEELLENGQMVRKNYLESREGK